MVFSSQAAKLKRHLSYEEQAREIIRGKIISGEFSAGEKLPSSREIAASLGLSLCTVHGALSALQSEKLLIGYPRRGVFVRERRRKLTCVGVYSSATVKDAPYSHAVNKALMEELHEAGIEMDLWVDSRPHHERGKPWKPLIKAAQELQFQGFIATEIDHPLLQWQQKLPVPTAFVDGPFSISNNVDQDLRQFAEISLRKLAQQGCRSVGFIAPVMGSNRFMEPDGSHNKWLYMLEYFTSFASDVGLAIKSDWMRISHAPFDCAQGREHFGYRQFLKLWSQRQKPEGLIVFDDVTVRGVLMAIQEQQVRVPADLKLILHKNESIDLLCPMPATFVVNSEREAARALIKQVQKQFRGESCERISLPYKLVTHAGS